MQTNKNESKVFETLEKLLDSRSMNGGHNAQFIDQRPPLSHYTSYNNADGQKTLIL